MTAAGFCIAAHQHRILAIDEYRSDLGAAFGLPAFHFVNHQVDGEIARAEIDTNRQRTALSEQVLGLGAVDRLPAVKRLLMRHAMGDIDDTPRLVRGLPV